MFGDGRRVRLPANYLVLLHWLSSNWTLCCSDSIIIIGKGDQRTSGRLAQQADSASRSSGQPRVRLVCLSIYGQHRWRPSSKNRGRYRQSSTCISCQLLITSRCQSSSPLGELFDHGCDALNATFGTILQASAMGLGFTWRESLTPMFPAALRSHVADFNTRDTTTRIFDHGAFLLFDCGGVPHTYDVLWNH